MKYKNIGKGAVVLFIAVTMILTSFTAIANTENIAITALQKDKSNTPNINLAYGDMLWDNNMEEEVEGGWSMFDYTAYGANRSLMDDFEIPSGETWNIGIIQVIGVYYNNASSGTDMVLSFREDDAGTPGDIITTVTTVNWSDEWTGTYIFGNRLEFLVTYVFEPIELTEGLYWIDARVVSNDNFFAEVTNHTTVGILEEAWCNWEYDGYFGPGSTSSVGYAADLKYALYEPDPELPEFKIDVTGGLGVTATIENIGIADATNVEATFTFSGGIMLLPAGGSKTVAVGDIAAAATGSANTFVFGLGKPVITVDVTCDEGATASTTYEPTLVLLFFVL
jgi:hypothetical protein